MEPTPKFNYCRFSR